MRQYRTGNTIAAGGCLSSNVKLKDGTEIGQVPVVKEKGCYADYSMDRQRIYVASLSANSEEDGETYVALSLCSIVFHCISLYFIVFHSVETNVVVYLIGFFIV